MIQIHKHTVSPPRLELCKPLNSFLSSTTLLCFSDFNFKPSSNASLRCFSTNNENTHEAASSQVDSFFAAQFIRAQFRSFTKRFGQSVLFFILSKVIQWISRKPFTGFRKLDVFLVLGDQKKEEKRWNWQSKCVWKMFFWNGFSLLSLICLLHIYSWGVSE